MHAGLSLPQFTKIVQCMNPATDAAGRTGQYVGLKHGAKIQFIWNITQGNAATIALSFLQGNTAAGGGSKAIAATTYPIWFNLDCSLTDTLIPQAAAATFTTDAGLKNKIVVMEVDAAQLDVAGGFSYVAPVTGASNVANLTQCIGYVIGERFQQATPPTAILP